ncbi:hypothetical protein [Sulfitobacter sp.]|uniref:purine-cytosine permease family protein n=1 Tax=Sulfitobacter sp. TaxID=1903071 RepID=UPI0032997468
MPDLFPTNPDLSQVDEEQLPVPEHRRYRMGHFFGLYGAEHIAATEFVIGATLVTLGASFNDVVFGLLIGNLMAVLSFWLITARIATDVRLSLYAYLGRIAGTTTSTLYNGVNVIFFGMIAAAMITVAATGVTLQLDVPAQTAPYPTSLLFVAVVAVLSVVVVAVAIFGFEILSDFASISAPWLATMFICGAVVLIPPLLEAVNGQTTASIGEFVALAKSDIFTGETPDGSMSIGFWGVAGFAWAANSIAHFGLIDMALLRYARKSWYGIASSSGLIVGHYIGWICAGIMGAAVATLTQTPLTEISPGKMTFEALNWTGLIIVVVAGWTTANSNLYRAGLAAQSIFPDHSRAKVTAIVGAGVVCAAVFPFFYRSILPLLTYAGLAVMPIGGIVFAEHVLFKRFGMTRYWMHLKNLPRNIPALITWAAGIAFAALLNIFDFVLLYYIFLPTWAFSVVLYTILARAYGAADEFPDAQREQAGFEAQISAFHKEQAQTEGPVDSTPEPATLDHIIRWVWILGGLIAPLAFAAITLFASPDIATYDAQVDVFYTVALCSTLLYFTTAYWGLRRQKAQREASHRRGSKNE